MLGFIVSGSDSSPVLELVEEALDEIAPAILLAVMGCRVLAVAFGRDHSLDFRIGQFLTDGVGVIALVGEQRCDAVHEHPEQRVEALDIMRLSRRQHETEWAALGVAAGVELAREAAARSAKRLGFLSPLFMPTAQ